jgi:hypothetical protein
VNEARGWIEIVKQNHDLQVGLKSRFRYLDQKDITVKTEPESKKKRQIREAHLSQAQKRQADSGIVVNIFSRYMGRRVPVIDSEVQVSAGGQNPGLDPHQTMPPLLTPPPLLSALARCRSGSRSSRTSSSPSSRTSRPSRASASGSTPR